MPTENTHQIEDLPRQTARTALGRADLLRLLLLWGKGAEHAAAQLAGFIYQPPEPELSQRQMDAVMSATPAESPVQQELEEIKEQTGPEPPQRLFQASISNIVQDAQHDQYLQRLNACDVDDGQPLPALPQYQVPAWQGLSTNRRLAVFAEQYLRRKQNVAQLDAQKLARFLSQARLPKPQQVRLQKKRWRGNALVIHLDAAHTPLQQDYQQLAQVVQHRSGGRVPIYLQREHGWAQFDPHAGGAWSDAQRWCQWRTLRAAPSLLGLGGVLAGGNAQMPRGWQPQVCLGIGSPARLELPFAHWEGRGRIGVGRQVQLAQPAAQQITELLALMSLAIHIAPPLLRALRHLLHMPAQAEVLAWNHQHVQGNGVAIALHQDHRPTYVQELATLPLPLRQQAARCIAYHHAHMSVEMALEEAQLAQTHAPGSGLPAPEIYFAYLARNLQSSALTLDVRQEAESYLLRAGHRCDAAVWQVSAEFGLAWARANPDALRHGEGLPRELPVDVLANLRRKLFGDGGQQKQGLRLRQIGNQLQLEICTLQDLQERVPEAETLVAQWACGPLVQIVGGPRVALNKALPVLDLAGVENLVLSDGETICQLQPVVPPNWALAMWRDGNGIYALAPNPFGKPVATPYPRQTGEQVQFILSREAPQIAKQKWAVALQFDAIGLRAEISLKEGEIFHNQTLRYILPGQFIMGSPATEKGRIKDEGPQHQVSISQGFWLADTACSQGFWQALMGNNPSRFDESNGGGADFPVESVSWHDVQKCLQKLGRLLPFCDPSLPTEAEWEYACRAGSQTPFSFGDSITTEQVNFNGRFAWGEGKDEELGKNRRRTVAVKSLPANAWGLYQMHGNVWEWCLDGVRDYGEDSVRDPGLAQGTDARAGAGHKLRAVRGGGWISCAQSARSAYRLQSAPDVAGNFLGWRLALRSKP